MQVPKVQFFAFVLQLFLLVGINAHAQSPIYKVAVTADGKKAIAADDERVIRIFDLTTGKWIQTVECDRRPNVNWPPTRFITSPNFAFSSDGRLALVSSGERHFRETAERDPPHLSLWDLELGRRVRDFNVRDEVRSIALSPDGRRALSDSISRREVIYPPHTLSKNRLYEEKNHFAVRLWDATTGLLIKTLIDDGLYYNVRTPLVFTEDGKFCIAIYRNGIPPYFKPEKAEIMWQAKIWNAETGVLTKSIPLKMYRPNEDNPVAIAVSPDGKRLAIARGGMVDLWDIENFKREWAYSFTPKGATFVKKEDNWSISAVSFSKNGDYIIICGYDEWPRGPGGVRVVDKNGEPHPTFKTSKDSARSVSMTPDGRFLIGSGSGVLRRWNVKDGTFTDISNNQ